jgi:hypothetical protein
MSKVFLGAVMLIAAMTSGCVIYVSDDGDGFHASRGSAARNEQRNRDVIGRLDLGTPIEEVLQRLGKPDFSEAWTSEGVEVRVLRYRTHRTEADGDTTVDETTPLVFRAGRLVGVGERAVSEPVSGAADPGGKANTGYFWRYL